MANFDYDFGLEYLKLKRIVFHSVWLKLTIWFQSDRIQRHSLGMQQIFKCSFQFKGIRKCASKNISKSCIRENF